ncbi:uncharacterized protein [Aegilops tauschii subsp. strangulata]|uniref:uncharacterized protein n=1 Tax=Aegilops tauschii subsp. strangulata TaxID=200361 RepID=UPI001E1CA12F|nr:uncharacterized protein LOC123497703 [Aegilops tauschii subsp. strangulata]
MQVLRKPAFIDVMIPKVAKLKKIYSMPMAYKIEFEHVIGRDDKSKKQWSKSKYLHKCNVKHLKTVMHSDKHKNVVKHKHLSVKHKHVKHNTHSARPLEPSTSTTAKCVNKRKHSVKHDKKKPPDAKSNKKGETKRICLVLLDKNDTKWNKCLKTLLHAKGDITRNEHLKTFLHGKSDIKTTTMMKNSATASSS